MRNLNVNKEETLGFMKKRGGMYRIYMLSKHPLYKDKLYGKQSERYPEFRYGGFITDPENISYDCWIGDGVVCRGKLSEGTVIEALGRTFDYMLMGYVTKEKFGEDYAELPGQIGPNSNLSRVRIVSQHLSIQGQNDIDGLSVYYDEHKIPYKIEIQDSSIRCGLYMRISPGSQHLIFTIKNSIVESSSVCLSANKFFNMDNSDIKADSLLIEDTVCSIKDSLFIESGNLTEEKYENVIKV